MVRINRTYSIDEDLVNKLKDEENVSELINSLLLAYFNKTNSKDLKALKKNIDDIENQLDTLRRERDRLADDIREIETKSEENEYERIRELENEKHIKDLSKWLSNKVKSKEISFDDFVNIKKLDNWEDCVELIIDGKLDLLDVCKKALPKEETEENQNI